MPTQGPPPPARRRRSPLAAVVLATTLALAIAALAARHGGRRPGAGPAVGGSAGQDAADRDATASSASTTARRAPSSSAGGGATTVPPTTVPSGPAVLEWSPCGDDLDCATLTVPWSAGSASTMAIPVIRAPATDPAQRIGSLVLNPGGPGASGVEFLRAAAWAFGDLNERFDLVSFDPRGVGAADPAIRCRTDLDDGVFVLGPGGLAPQQHRAQLEQFRQQCLIAQPELIPAVGTDAVAADLDRLRAALGDERLTYLGFSYGTRLGAAYAGRHPERVRAMVLDGADVSNVDVIDSAAEQYRAFDEAFARFARSCPAAGGCHTGQYGGAGAVFRTVEAAARAGPLGIDGSDRQLTLGELYLGAAAALYDATTWDALDGALAAAHAGDGGPLQRLADGLLGRRGDGSYHNIADANIAVNCADDRDRLTYEEAEARGAALAAELDWFGPLASTAFFDCVGWPSAAEPAGGDGGPAATGIPAGTAAATAPGAVVVIGTTGDPATPFAWAGRLAAALPGSVLVTHRGEGHGAYFASSCVRELVRRQLLEPGVVTAQDCG